MMQPPIYLCKSWDLLQSVALDTLTHLNVDFKNNPIMTIRFSCSAIYHFGKNFLHGIPQHALSADRLNFSHTGRERLIRTRLIQSSTNSKDI